MKMDLSPKPVDRPLGRGTQCLAAIAFAAPLALGLGLGPANASTTVTYSQTVGDQPLYAAWTQVVSNFVNSSGIAEIYEISPDFTTPYLQLTFDGLDLPTGATITSAVLAYQLAPSEQRTGPAQLTMLDAVNERQWPTAPTITAQASARSILSSIITGDKAASYTSDFRPPSVDVLDGPEFNGSYYALDLLGLGFGSNLAAGHATEVAVTTQIFRYGAIFVAPNCIGCQPGDTLPVNTGYNAVARYQAFVNFTRPTEAFKLIVTYDSPATSAAPEPASWALMLLGFGGLGATLRRQRRVVA